MRESKKKEMRVFGMRRDSTATLRTRSHVAMMQIEAAGTADNAPGLEPPRAKRRAVPHDALS